MTDAALGCGYDSTSAYIAAFKQLFGATPGIEALMLPDPASSRARPLPQSPGYADQSGSGRALEEAGSGGFKMRKRRTSESSSLDSPARLSES